MTPELPPQPRPDPVTLARAQARLLAGLSAIQGTEPTEASDSSPRPGGSDPGSGSQHVSWLGPQGDWEAGRHVEPTASERYRFGAVFARGGLGAVRRAEDRKLGRTVAIKELLRFDDRAVDRFVREAAITARLQHPGIVPLYDLGRGIDGRPFLCMKLVEGASLEQRIAACADLPARLQLLGHVCAAADAVAYAHRQGVVHRDLKPANILVGEHGEAVVIDWGLAKDMSQGTDDSGAPGEDPGAISDLTAAGSLLGTLRYMPPEQARGERVDARSDIYALGAVLYHVLAGVPPFHDRRAAELVRAVLEERPRPLAELAPGVPAALVAIVDKAMSPETHRRYAAAEAFADDLRRFQAGLLVGAHAYSLAEVGRLWLRRHRGVSAVAIASLVALGVVGVISFGRIREARDVAEDQRVAAEAAQVVAQQRADEAEAARRLADGRADALLLSQARLALEVDPGEVFGLLAQLEPDPARDGAVRVLATAAHAQAAAGTRMTGPKDQATEALHLSDGTWLVSARDGLWRWRPGEVAGARIGEAGVLVATADGATWAVIRGVSKGETEIEVYRAGAVEPTRIAVRLDRRAVWYRWQLRPDGAVLFGAPILASPMVEIEVASGRLQTVPGPDAPAAVAGLQLQGSADGRFLAGGRDRRTLVVWERDTGKVHRVALPGVSETYGNGWTPDGRAFVALARDAHAAPDRSFVDGGDRVLVWRPDAAPRTVAASWAVPAHGALVFIGERDGAARAWAEDLDGRRLWTQSVRAGGPEHFVLEPIRSRDGRLVRWGFGDAVDVVDVASGTLVRVPRRSVNEVPLIEHGDLLVPRAGGLRRIEVAQAAWQTAWPAPASGTASLQVSPGGDWAVRQAGDRVVRVDARSGAEEALPAACGPWTPSHTLAATADDGRALIVDRDGHGCLWGHGRSDRFETPPEWLVGASLAPDGSRFALGFADGTLREWTDPGAAPRELPVTDFHSFVEYAPDSSVLAVVDTGGAAKVIDRDGAVRTVVERRFPDADRYVRAGATFAPDGATLAVYRRGDPELVIVDVMAGTQTRLTGVAPIPADANGGVIRYSPSGQALAVHDGDVVQRWELARPDAPERVTGVLGRDLAFLDERTLVVLGEAGGLEIVDPGTGTHAPLRAETAGRVTPRLGRTPGGLMAMTATGEVLRFTDTLPPAGAPLHFWLKGHVVP